MPRRQLLSIGTKIIAIRNIGPVQEGQPGIITGLVQVPYFFWSRTAYLCTFFGNIGVSAYPKEVDEFNHEFSLEALEENQSEKSVAEQLRAIRPDL